MIELKRMRSSTDRQTHTSVAPKRQKADAGASMSSKETKEKVGERIVALQQLVSPFGKADTASVLLEAIDYIRFLHEQVKVLSTPYLHRSPITNMEEQEQCSLRRRGLCLMPMSNTVVLAQSNGADIWAPIKSASPGV